MKTRTRKRIEKDIEKLDELIENLESRWDTSMEFNILDIGLINEALKDAKKYRNGLQVFLDLLDKD